MKSNVRQLRREKDITQMELASAIGVSQQVISRIERDRDRIQIDTLVALADYFGVSTDCILGYHRKSRIQPIERRIMAQDIRESGAEQEILDLEQKVYNGDENGLFGLLVDLKRCLAE